MQTRNLLLRSGLLLLSSLLSGCTSAAPPAEPVRESTKPAASGDEALIDQLVLLNRMLASQEMGR